MVDYYAVLEVDSDASQIAIKKSYFALAKKYHPDIYPDKEFAVKKMALINEAYAVLRDPEKRKEYDMRRLRLQKQSSAGQQSYQSNHRDSYQKTEEKREDFNFEGLNPLQICILRALDLAQRNGEIIHDPKNSVTLSRINGTGFTFMGKSEEDKFSGSYITKHWFTFLWIPILPLKEYRVLQMGINSYIVISSRRSSKLKKMAAGLAAFWVLGGILLSAHLRSNANRNTRTKPPVSTSAPKKQSKPDAAKINKSLTPQTGIVTGYVKGEPVKNNKGHSIIEIDNSKNDVPVYVRIWALGDNPRPVRSFRIKEGEKFSAKNLTRGRYDVRFKYLYKEDAKYGAKSNPIQLKESIDFDTNIIHYSHYSLTLYKVVNGNTQLQQIPVDEI